MVANNGHMLGDAYLVSRYASETGVPVKPLAEAIVAAEKEIASGNLTVETAQTLMAAQGDAIKNLNATNIRVIRAWFSRVNTTFSVVNRCLVFAVVFLCLINVVPLTFVYSDTVTRVQNIASFCGDKISTALSVQKANKNPEAASTEINVKTEDSLKQCLSVPFFQADDIETASLSAADTFALERDALIGNRNIGEASQDAIAIKLYATPSTALMFLDAGARYINTWWGFPNGLISNPTNETELQKKISEAAGSVLYSAAQDYGFVLYVLGSGYLPMIYGMLGSSVFILRRCLSTDPNDYMLTSSMVQVLMRIGLGGVAGIIVGWFNIPTVENVTTLASTQFVLAFLAGFSIDIVFSFLDRLLAVFETKKA